MDADRKPCTKCGNVHQWCSAHRNDGKPCGRRPHKGATVCHGCGGGAPQVKAAAARVVAEERARALAQTLGAPIEHDLREGLLQAIFWAAGHTAFFRSQVQALAPDALIWGITGHRYGHGPEGPIDVTDEASEAHAWLKLYNAERDRYSKLVVEAIRIGLDERRVKLAEQQAGILVESLGWLMAEARLRLDLSEAGQSALSDLVREMLGRMDAAETVGVRR